MGAKSGPMGADEARHRNPLDCTLMSAQAWNTILNLGGVLLLFTGVIRGQLPFHPKFLAPAGGLEHSPFLEAQRDALNLHEGDDASVAVAAPIAINCTARGTEFKATLLQKGARSRPGHARFNAHKKLLRIRPRHF